VREVPDPKVGTHRAQHPRRQEQVVVLDHHPRVGGGFLGQRLRERLVVTHVGGPLPAPGGVKDRRLGEVVQHVQHEPERRVRDTVVGVAEGQPVDRQHPHVEVALQRVGRELHFGEPPAAGLACQRALAIVHGRAHPHRVRRRTEGVLHAADQPATAPPDLVVAVLDRDDGQRASIGGDQ